MSGCTEYFQKGHQPNLLQYGVSLFALPGSLEMLQTLNLDDAQEGTVSLLRDLPERKIGRWNYTVVPWED
jgi:hypothetical protein